MISNLKITKEALLLFLRRNPHWCLFALSLLCWANYLLVGMQQGIETHHHHHPVESFSFDKTVTQGAAWLLMVYAMMLPMLSGALRWLLTAQPRYRRTKAAVSFLLGYSGLWLLIGLTLIFLQTFISDVLGVIWPRLTELPYQAITFLVAGLISRTEYRRRAVYACGAGIPMRINGWPALYDSLQFGFHEGIRCAASCVHLMVALMIAGHGILLMLLVTAVLFYERQQLPRKTRLVELFCYLIALGYLLSWMVAALV